MEKNMTVTTVGFLPNMLRKYDEIAGATYVNLYTLSKNSDTITIAPFDPKNEEHLFILGVAKGLSAVISKPVCLDVSRFQLWKLNWRVKKEAHVRLIDGKEAIYAINPDQLLNFMRKEAIEYCGDDFTFADIYKAFYSRKKDK